MAFESGNPKMPRTKMIMLGFVVACMSMLLGMIQGFVIAAVPQIKGSINDISWFASVCGFVAPLGSLLIGVIIDKFGRRSALLCSIVPSIFGWLAVYLSQDMGILLLGRALSGLSYGALHYPQQVYAAECLLINQQRLLDSFKIWTGVTSSLGGIFCLVLSLFLNYRELAGAILVVTIIEFVLVFELLPESPIWLTLQSRYGDAEWAQKRLGIHTSILYDEGVSGVEAASSTTENRFSIAAIKNDLKKMKRPDVYKPLVVCLVLFALIMASGPMPINAYMITIMGNAPVDKNSTSSSVDPDEVSSSDSLPFSILSAIFNLLAHLILSFILPYTGIRRITIPCIFLMAVGFGMLAYTTNAQSADLYIVRVISVWEIVFVYNFGMYNLPGALLGYVFPVDCKGYASIVSAVYMLLSAISIKSYPYLEEIFDGNLYYGYMTIAVLTGIFAFFFMPETVGKSQKEISDEFSESQKNISDAEFDKQQFVE